MFSGLRGCVLLGLFAFFTAACASAIIWENGDVEHKWFVAKAWASFEFPGFPVNHHNLRWGMNLPAVAAILAFGDSPLTYLLMQLAIFAATSAMLFYLMRAVGGTWIALAAAGCWLAMPTTYFMASNLMPGLYSNFYLAAALLLLYLAYSRNSWPLYTAAVVALFLTYGAKETSVFFYPGLGLFELLRRRFDRLGILIGVSALLLVAETLLTNVALQSLGVVGGRLQGILLGNHVDGMVEEFNFYRPVDLITRWGFLNTTEIPSKFVYYGLFAASAYALWLWRRNRIAASAPASDMANREFVLAAAFLGLSFAFCTTFFVISFDPFLPGQPLGDLYLWPLLAPGFVVLSAGSLQAWLHAKRGGWVSAAAISPALWRAGAAAIVVFVALAPATRLGFRLLVEQTTREGFIHPYSAPGANRYFAQIRERLDAGCELVFASKRAAWSSLVFAYPYGHFVDPVALYVRDLEGLYTRDGAQVRAVEVDAAAAASLSPRLPDLLHVQSGPEGPATTLMVLRLERTDKAALCRTRYYLGHLDIHERDQALPVDSRSLVRARSEGAGDGQGS